MPALLFFALVAYAATTPTEAATVWLGRVAVFGQCTTPGERLAQLRPGPGVLEVRLDPPAPLGPRFRAWADADRNQRYEAGPAKFLCEACRVCQDFGYEFVRVPAADAARFTGHRLIDR